MKVRILTLRLTFTLLPFYIGRRACMVGDLIILLLRNYLLPDKRFQDTQICEPGKKYSLPFNHPTFKIFC